MPGMTPEDIKKLRKMLAAGGNVRLDKPVKKFAVKGIKKMNEMPSRPGKTLLPKKKAR